MVIDFFSSRCCWSFICAELSTKKNEDDLKLTQTLFDFIWNECDFVKAIDKSKSIPSFPLSLLIHFIDQILLYWPKEYLLSRDYVFKGNSNVSPLLILILSWIHLSFVFNESRNEDEIDELKSSFSKNNTTNNLNCKQYLFLLNRLLSLFCSSENTIETVTHNCFERYSLSFYGWFVRFFGRFIFFILFCFDSYEIFG